jgi:hypothetical protein
MKTTPKPLQIFKAGTHTAMNGVALSFTEADLKATAAAYDPAKHEAPLVVGHPQHDTPAYGWVGSLAFAGGALEATPVQVNADFSEQVAQGAYKKMSASFYAPDSPNNPVPNVYYLRHIGFLGAQPPAIKGLRSPSFAEGEKGVVDFSEYDDVQNAGLWRRLREWLIGEKGQDIADQVVPSWTVQQLEQAAQDELREAQQEDSNQAGISPAFSEEGATMTPEEKARLEALEAENAKLKAAQVQFAEAEKKRTADARHTANLAFAEGLVKEGKLLPVQKDVLIASLDFMENQDTVVNFGEGAAQKPLATAMKDMFTAMPKLVHFGESAPASLGVAIGSSESAPVGYSADTERLDTHKHALAYAKQHNVSYMEAVAAVIEI